MKIAIAGASGFIGSHLIPKLLENPELEIIALSRRNKSSANPRLQWKQCDLFSMLEIEKSVMGCDILIYMVHSMLPSARLDQADFRDYDLLLADNFGRAAKDLEIEKVIYLGGIIPEKTELSSHLKSRLEVEKTLKYYIPQYTILRAGLILGAGGSSFNLLLNLVKNLPMLLCPRWTRNKTSPIHVKQVTETISQIIKDNDFNHKVYDLASKENISYLQLMKKTAECIGLDKTFVSFKFNFLAISKFWVHLFSRAPKHLVYPLVDSLKHEMIPREDRVYQGVERLSVDEAIELSCKEAKDIDYKFASTESRRTSVRSLQRFEVDNLILAKDVAKAYMWWLPRFLYPFVIVHVSKNWVNFSLFFKRFRLLVLRLSEDRSTEDRQIFYIKGGILAKAQKKGRFEIRNVLNKRTILVAIHDFYPALPWYVYIYTQAPIHLFVMRSFGKYLRRTKKFKKKAT